MEKNQKATEVRTIDDLKGVEAKRSFTLKVPNKRELKVDEEARTVELAFSSETPYERYWGVEILDHSRNAIDLSRLQSGGAVLMDHDTRDQIGVVESVRIDDDRVARAVVRFSRSQRGQDIFNDIIDGIRQNVSVGYFIEDLVLEERSDDIDTYRVTRWQPFEISIVSVPADPTVGVGRSHGDKNPGMVPAARTEETPTEPTAEEKSAEAVTDDADDEQLQNVSEASDLEQSESENLEDTTAKDEVLTTPKTQESKFMDPKDQNVDVVAQERARINDLMDIGERFGAKDLAQKCVNEGLGVADLNAMILERKGYDAKPAEQTTELGLDEKEKRGFSFRKLMNALANPNDKAAQRAAGFELEVGAEAAKKSNKDVRGVMVPHEVLAHRMNVADTADAGGNLIANDLLSGSFIEILQNRLSIMSAGATMLTGLEGNIAIPRQSGGAAAYWLAENGEPTGSSATFDQIALTPKTVGAFTEVSRKLLQQGSIDVEQFIRMELIR
ncbi:MAG: phage major capsid protein, partial [Pseudomonas sp.]|nr:phage major capsid protein [Pseudomonas sp.]